MTKLEQMAREIVAEAMKDFEPKEYPFIQGLLIEMGRAVIAVLYERCIDHACYAEGQIVDEHNPDESWGNTYSANDALELLQSLDKQDAKPTDADQDEDATA